MIARELERPSLTPLGDGALLVRLGEGISRELAMRVRATAHVVATTRLHGVTDVVPSYASFSVHFDSRLTGYATLRATVATLLRYALDEIPTEPRVVEVPTVYAGDDLLDVAERTKMSVEEVVRLHSSRDYYVYMLGFLPGFGYLGDLDPALVLERRAIPRQRVPRGSVAIAGAQTAVYPLDSPGGWHIIGHTSLVMFDAQREEPGLLRAGDIVRFVPVSA